MPKVNPRNLRWAREGAGLSLEQAARKIGMPGPLASQRLAELERGEREPTRVLLTRMASNYHRSLLSFYLAEPPTDGKRLHDFRTLPDRETGSEATLESLVRSVHVRQALVRDALEDLDEADRKAIVGSFQSEAAGSVLAVALQNVLHLDRNAYRAQPTAESAFALLRTAAERAGVFVLLAGNLGHHSTDVSAAVFRGLAIADPIAPFIVVNPNDAKIAWSFTLLHELVHIMLGESAISGYGGEDRVERICDEAASRFLLDPTELVQLEIAENTSVDVALRALDAFASPRRLSRKMVAYNAFLAGRLSARGYGEIARRLDAERIMERKGKTNADSGGPDYYVVRRHRLGTRLVDTVGRMVAAGVLSAPRAGMVLGVKATAVDRLTRHLSPDRIRA